MFSRWRLTIAVLFAVVLQAQKNVASIGVMGQRARCSNEGETVAVDSIDKQKCFTCICKNGFVECYNYQTCPEIDGCHMVVEKPKDDCCFKCKGCYYNGIYHESKTEWTELKQPCRILKCEAGVVTKSELQCHVPCDNPIPPATGKCCPTCPDCSLNGEIASDDRDVTSGDLCVKCSCRNSKMSCSKNACPVLQCPREDQRSDPGECCPRCVGKRSSHIQMARICVLGSKVYKEDETISIDLCTKCKCVNQTSICERRTCPILDCPVDLQKRRGNGCCKECVQVPEAQEMKSQCSHKGKTYEEGQSWTLNACTLCKCHGGRIVCAMTKCNTTLPCPMGTHLVQSEGECCDRCEEIKSEAACMVFGDPHYKSFDGKIFSFQGLGKYQLVSDCYNHSFAIRITNDYSNDNRTSTAIKRVRVKFGDIRLNLGQKYRMRVNGNKVQVPYVKTGKLQVEKNEYYLRVVLGNDVKILWNGKSFLEVTVPSSFKNKLCGLCGNFNSNVQDDLKMRKGGVVNDSNLMRFGNSWCVGKDCARQAKRTALIRPCKPKAHRRHWDRNPCKYLTSTELFNGCDSKLSYTKYLNACIKDMCDCPNGKCYCESLMAYAQECQRLGVTVSNWQKNSYCVGNADDTKSRNKQKHKSPTYTQDEIELLSLQLHKKHNKGNAPIIH